MTTEWPTEAREAVAEIIREATQTLDNMYDTADAVLVALAPHVQTRTDETRQAIVADLTRMADGREQYRNGPEPVTATDLNAMDPWERDLWGEVTTWRTAAKLAGGDREVFYGMPSWCWDDSMVAELHAPKESKS